MTRRLLISLSLWFLLLAPLAAADQPKPRFTFQRGVNISHWLSQLFGKQQYANPTWFNETDVAWLKDQGYDHIRMPVDGRLLVKTDKTLDPAKLKPFDDAVSWCRKHGLGIILDIHFLEGADFNVPPEKNRLFSSADVLEDAARFWKRLAEYYQKIDNDLLRFELLNEPVAPRNQLVNKMNLRLLAAIREVSPQRVVYLTSNRWGSFSTAKDLEIPNDPHVALTFHFYEPFIFTHQQTMWTDIGKHYKGQVKFPGKVADLRPFFPKDHWVAKNHGNRELTVRDVDRPFAELADWAKTKAKGKEIYIGEFGAFNKADPESRQVWTAAVLAACQRHHFSWAVWDYKGSFAIRDRDGKGTVINEVLRGKR